MVIIENEDYRILKPIKIVPIWDIFKSKLGFVFMILTCSLIFVISLSLSQDSAIEESNEQELKGRDPAVWHVGLKVAWDIETPGLAIPLHQGDIYLMLGNFQGLRS